MYTNYDRAYLTMRFDRIERAMKEGGMRIMATVEELNASVANLEAAADSIIAALGASTGINPADLDPAVAKIDAVVGKLNDAVHAHQM